MKMQDYEISIGEIPKILKLYWGTKIPVYFIGAPGIGKSDLVREFCREMAEKYKREFIEWFDIYGEKEKEVLNHPEKYFLLVDVKLYELEPQDVKGFIFIDKDKDSVTIIPWNWMKFFYSDKSMGVIFLDELNMAHREVMKVAFQLMYQRVLGNKRIRGEVLIAAAGNPPKDNYLAVKLPIPLQDRMAIYYVKATYEDWISYANKHNLNIYVRKFLSLYPDKLLVNNPDSRDKITSPRSWTMLSYVLDKIDVEKIDEGSLYKIVSAHIDEDTSSAFVRFVKNYKTLTKLFTDVYKRCIEEPDELYSKENDVDFMIGFIEYISSLYLQGKLHIDKMLYIIEVLYSMRPEYIITLFITMADKIYTMKKGKNRFIKLLDSMKIKLSGLYDLLIKTNIETCLTLVP